MAGRFEKNIVKMFLKFCDQQPEIQIFHIFNILNYNNKPHVKVMPMTKCPPSTAVLSTILASAKYRGQNEH